MSSDENYDIEEEKSLLHPEIVVHNHKRNAPSKPDTHHLRKSRLCTIAFTALLSVALIYHNFSLFCLSCTTSDELAGSVEHVSSFRYRHGTKIDFSDSPQAVAVSPEGLRADKNEMLCKENDDWELEQIRFHVSSDHARKMVTVVLMATPRMLQENEPGWDNVEIQLSNDAVASNACGFAPLPGGALRLQYWPVEAQENRQQFTNSHVAIDWTNAAQDALPMDVQLVTLKRVACLVRPESEKSTFRAMYTFVGELTGLANEQHYVYRLGHGCSRSRDSEQTRGDVFYHYGEPEISQNRTEADVVLARKQNILVVGDMGDNCPPVVKGMQQHNDVSLFLLIGDASYATNDGSCYSGKGVGCTWNCPSSEPNCESYNRYRNMRHRGTWKKWNKIVHSLFKGTTVMSTNGNHDNDWQWFMQFRAPVRESFVGVPDEFLSETQQKGLQTLVESSQYTSGPRDQITTINGMYTEPYFYSFQQGLVYFISIGTEDNVNNAYETKGTNIPLRDERFELHYGVNSLQYRWLERELKIAQESRDKTPWIILYTHRPFTHASSHHGLCSSSGDWYGCKFRELYAALVSKYGVDLVLGGHSHHYARLKPFDGLKLSPETAKSGNNATTYVICGTGGLLQEMHLADKDFVAFQLKKLLGYCKLEVISADRLDFTYYGTPKGGKQQILDTVTLWH